MANSTPAPIESRCGRILVVDDERSMRELLQIVLRREGHQVRLAENGRAAVAELEREPVDVLISDIKMPGMTGVDVLREAKRIDPDIVGIMVTAYATTDTAVEALRLGAYDYLTKPFDVEELKAKVRNALERRTLRQENVLLKRALRSSSAFSNIIGRSKADAGRVRPGRDRGADQQHHPRDGGVGNRQGTGRARRAHQLAPARPGVRRAQLRRRCPRRCSSRSCSATCAARSPGAATTKKGLLEAAERGTVFLDEISEMSTMMQVKLLRVLQERKFRRVGGTEEIDADIRIIAATNRDLAKAVTDGAFREDLYYRINVIPVHLPPLRERREDITPLAEHFVAKYREVMGKPVTGLTPEALRWLEAADWPGNVRQLENVIERAVALERGPLIQLSSLPNGNGPKVRRPRGRGVGRTRGTARKRARSAQAPRVAGARARVAGAAAERRAPRQGREAARDLAPPVPLPARQVRPPLTITGTDH